VAGADDLQCLVEGIQAARKVVAQQAFDFCRGEELLPGKDVQSQQQLEAWVTANVDTGYHPVGTCRMAGGCDMPSMLAFQTVALTHTCPPSGSAADGVVDGALRVHGVRGLRVADASVFPHIPNGNTQAATFMVAERAAEMILAAAAAE
jgi:choline dehydrogenase